MQRHSISQVEVVVGWSKTWFEATKMKVQFLLMTFYTCDVHE